ncbi:RNA polymerase sigma factor RpoD/SigA [Paenibacillus sp. GCM10027629]
MILASEMDLLQWFIVAFPNKHSIKLSYAQRMIEQSLAHSVEPEEVLEFLKVHRYRYIDVDLEVSMIEDNKIMNSSSHEYHQESSVNKKAIKFDDIDDILDQPLEPKQPFIEDTNESYSTSYQMNDYMLDEYSRSHNPLIKQIIVVANMSLVHSIVNKHRKYMSHSMTDEDLHQEGVFGLMDAIERFDTSIGGTFSTYATHWIRQRVIRSMMNYGTTVRVPVHLIERIRKIKKTEATYIDNQDNPIVTKHICEELEITEQQYLDAKLAEHRYLSFTSLNQHVGISEEGDTELGDFVPNDPLEVFVSMPMEFKDPFELTEHNILHDNIEHLLEKRLTEREQVILEFRFGLHDGRPRTLEEVGKVLGVTRERIRQIEAKALRKLRATRDIEKWVWIS